MHGNECQWARLLDAATRPGPGQDRGALLADAMDLGAHVVAGSVDASITERDGAGYFSPIAAGDVALALDAAQYADGTGPCVNAARDQQVQRFNTMPDGVHHRALVSAAEQHGVHSMMSLPLLGSQPAAALNLYADATAAFASPRAYAVTGLLGRCVAALLAGSPPDPAARGEVSEQLADVLTRRAVVEAARRRLQDTGHDPDQALAYLISRSRLEQRPIADVAADIAEPGSRTP